LAAGTTDIAIAEEAAQTLAWMGFQSFQVIDCGVAGPFRLLAKLDWIRRADVIVVVAGMEGALASVAGGLVSVPVIAVPTSIGYGANLQGITTMLSMLSSCAAGVTTVNIDGGFKGGYVAGLMCQRMKERGS
jgi:NCAIR mutase (PurE)-related protein